MCFRKLPESLKTRDTNGRVRQKQGRVQIESAFAVRSLQRDSIPIDAKIFPDHLRFARK